MKKCRKGARFIGDIRQVSRKIDRNERARIWFAAVHLEAQTREPGYQNGVLGRIGLVVLRTFLFKFMNKDTGACYPSIRRLQGAMDYAYSRSSIFEAVKRLEAAGILRRVARAKRKVEDGLQIMVQASNAYAFFSPRKNAHELPLARRASTVKERVADLVARWAKGHALPTRKSESKSRTEDTLPLFSLTAELGLGRGARLKRA